MSETVVEEAAARKQTLREELTARRKAMTPDIIDTRGLKVQSRFLATPYYQKARTVALYAPIRGEVPTRDILIAALQDEKIVCVPHDKLHPYFSDIQSCDDLPKITRQQIEHFFARYKDLEPGKWVKITGWGSAEKAAELIQQGIAAAAK